MQLAGWALLLIVPAIYLKAIDPLPAHAGNWPHFWKGIGVVMLIAGAALLVGALSGARDPWQPLAGLRGAAASEALIVARARRVARRARRRWIKASSQPVLLDFYADWCVSCKEMERETFADPRVQRQLAGWTLRADVTANSDDDKARCSRASACSARRRSSSSTRRDAKPIKFASSVSRTSTRSGRRWRAFN